MIAPDWRPVGKGRFCFYLYDSAKYAVKQFLLALFRSHRYSVDLRPTQGCKSTTETHVRWNGYINIPVLRYDELEDFLKQGPAYDPIVDRPASDPEEQNEFYLRNLLNFDDWKQTQDRIRHEHYSITHTTPAFLGQ